MAAGVDDRGPARDARKDAVFDHAGDRLDLRSEGEQVSARIRVQSSMTLPASVLEGSSLPPRISGVKLRLARRRRV